MERGIFTFCVQDAVFLNEDKKQVAAGPHLSIYVAQPLEVNAISWLTILGQNMATLGPIGKLPKAPGTWGSLAAALCAPWLFMPWEWPLRLALIGLLFIAGAWAAGVSEKLLKTKDPGQVVIDEVLGQWVSLLFVSSDAFWLLLAAFVLFRAFDVVKPWPIRASEQWLPGGAGVMIDDLLAGLMTAIILLFLQ